MTLRPALGTAIVATALLAFAPASAQMPPRYDAPSASPQQAQQTAPMPGMPAAGAPRQGAPIGAGGQPIGGNDGYVFSNEAPIDTQALDRSSQQMKGEYAPMERGLGIPLGMTQDAWSKPMQNMSPGQEAPGVVRFSWSPELVMPIRVRDAMVTMIRFPEWERLDRNTVVPGDARYVEYAVLSDNVLAVRSLQSGIDTSISVLGRSGNMYNFYLRAETYNTKKLTDMLVKVDAQPAAGNGIWQKGWNPGAGDGFSRGLQPSAPAAQQGSAGGHQSAPFAPAVPNVKPPEGALPLGATVSSDAMTVPRERMIFNLTMLEVNEGDREIAPEYVYTDGVWTYFHYSKRAASMDQPVIYRIVDGVETRVNTKTAGRFGEVIIAEAIGEFTLRNGQKTVCVKRKTDG